MNKIEFSNPYPLGNSGRSTTYKQPLHTLLRPYNIAGQHFNLVGELFANGNHSQMFKHAVIGSLELIPIINIIVVMVDRYFNEEIKSTQLNLEFMDDLQTISFEINKDEQDTSFDVLLNRIEQAPNYEENQSFQLTNNGEVIGYRFAFTTEEAEGDGILTRSFYLVRMNGQIHCCLKCSMLFRPSNRLSFSESFSRANPSNISPDILQKIGVNSEDNMKEVVYKILNFSGYVGFGIQEMFDGYFSRCALNQALHGHTKLPQGVIDLVVAYKG